MTTTKRLLGAGSAMLLAALVGSLGATGRAMGDPAPPPADLHQITYTISAEHPIWADIFYQDRSPRVFADYSHNPYEFTPQVHADIAPGKPWVQHVQLTNPDMWAMVVVTAAQEPGTPNFHCELAIDGRVAATKDGPRGALCSIRTF